MGSRWVHGKAEQARVATGKITNQSVKALEQTGATEFLWDDSLSGFGIRLTPNGAKSYIYQYRIGGREAPRRRVTIGKHGSPWTPHLARAEAERLALLVGQKIDPVEHARERRRQAVDLAFAAYVETFADGYLKHRWKDWRTAKSLLERRVVPILKNKPLPQIKKADIIEVLDSLKDSPAAAVSAFATLRKMFRWAEGRGEIERSPLAGIEAPTPCAARDRVLDDDELAMVWRASATLGAPFAQVFQMLIATGQRRDEVAALDWSELDRNTATWSLPAERAKNAQAHIVPLNALAIAALDEAAGVAGTEKPKWPRRGFVFTTTGETPVSAFSRAKSRLDTAITKVAAADVKRHGGESRELAPWRVHDLRRTLATGMQRLGVRFEVTEAILNHISGARGGVAGVYQRHDWKEEKRAALDAWAGHLSGLLGQEAAK